MTTKVTVSVVDGKLVIAGVDGTLELVTAAPPPVDPPPVDPPPPPPPPPPVDPPSTITRGVILDHAELMDPVTHPMTGNAWAAVLNQAKAQSIDGANLSDMHMQHDVGTLAVALAGVRLQDAALIAKAKACLTDAIGTEAGGDSMDVGRSLAAYVIAADTLGIRSGPIFDWLDSFRTKRIPHDNTGALMTIRDRAWETGTNASCQVGLCSVALAVYLRDAEWVRENWDAYRRICGDKTSPFVLKPNTFGDPWQADINNRVGIQPVGAVKNGLNIDGAYLDMGRSNPKPTTSLKYDARMSLYPWVSLNGIIWAGLIFHHLDRKAFPAFEIQDRAILRAVKFMRRLARDTGNMGWWGQDKKEDVKWLAHVAYPNDLPLSEYPITLPVGPHDQVGWSDWTHPTL